MTQFICSTIQSDISDGSGESHLRTIVDDMVEQLNNETNQDYAHHKSDTLVQTHPDDDDISTEAAYVEACLEELDNKGEIWDGDVWIIADGYDDKDFGYGYGNVSYSNANGEKVKGARVLHTPSQWVVVDPVETFYNLAIHEVGHCFDAWHDDGTYNLEIGDETVISDVSPMATCYTYKDDDIGDEFDTCWAGGSTPPSNFCDELPNNIADRFCDGSTGCKDECRHSSTMSDCAISIIEDNTPPI